jgi:hypothetical protein
LYGGGDYYYVLLGHGDIAVAEESATLPTWLFSALGWEAVICLRDVCNHQPEYRTVLQRRIQQFEAVPMLLFVLIIQCSNQQDITVSGSLTKGRLWEIQTLVMHFGRGFLFVVGKAASIS